MKINARHDLKDLMQTLAVAPDQVAFATAAALTQTAKDAKAAAEHEMRDVFERPTPYTMSAVFMKSATKAKQEAMVWLKDEATKAVPAATYLLPQIAGGERKTKRFERALQAVGAMPQGYVAVPGEAAKLDAYGNMDRGQIIQILAYFKAFPEAGYKANMTDKRKAALARGTKTKQGFTYFVGQPGGRAPLGIWQTVKFAKGTAVRPVMIFVERASYEATFDLKYVIESTVNRNFKKNFKVAVDQAMKTRRPPR